MEMDHILGTVINIIMFTINQVYQTWKSWLYLRQAIEDDSAKHAIKDLSCSRDHYNEAMNWSRDSSPTWQGATTPESPEAYGTRTR